MKRRSFIARSVAGLGALAGLGAAKAVVLPYGWVPLKRESQEELLASIESFETPLSVAVTCRTCQRSWPLGVKPLTMHPGENGALICPECWADDDKAKRQFRALLDDYHEGVEKTHRALRGD